MRKQFEKPLRKHVNDYRYLKQTSLKFKQMDGVEEKVFVCKENELGLSVYCVYNDEEEYIEIEMPFSRQIKEKIHYELEICLNSLGMNKKEVNETFNRLFCVLNSDDFDEGNECLLFQEENVSISALRDGILNGIGVIIISIYKY